MPAIKMKQSTKTFKVKENNLELIDAIFGILKSPLLPKKYALYNPKFKVIEFDKVTDIKDYILTKNGFENCFEALTHHIYKFYKGKFERFSDLDVNLTNFDTRIVYGLDEFIDFLVIFFKGIGQDRLAKSFIRNKNDSDFRKAIFILLIDVTTNNQDCDPYFLFNDFYNQERYTLKSLINYFSIKQQQRMKKLADYETFKQRERKLNDFWSQVDDEI